MDRTRLAALVAGLLYFSTHVTSVAAVIVYGPSLADPTAVLDGSLDGRVLGGAALEVLLALGCVGTGVVLLPLLAPYGRALAHAFSALRVLEAAVIAVGAMVMLALLRLSTAWAADAPDAAPAIAQALAELHQGSFLVGQGLVISVNTLVIAALLTRSRVVPRWIGVLGLVGGVAVLGGNIAQTVGAIEQGGGWAIVLAVPVFAFEICFATHLVARGLRPGRLPGASPLAAG